MRVTILGRSPSWQDAGGACSGYLVEQDATALLVDCGPGVFGRLRLSVDYADVAGVVVSHLHADHMLDLVPFASALTFGPRSGIRPALHAPAGAREALELVCRGGRMAPAHVADAFALREYAPGDELALGSLQVAFRAVPHAVPTHAIAVTAPGAGPGRVVFGADHGPSGALVAFAEGADLLLLEATLDHPESEGPRVHLTPGEAGEHARLARAGRLLLVHRSDELDAGRARDEAAAAFGGPVEVAVQGASFQL